MLPRLAWLALDAFTSILPLLFSFLSAVTDGRNGSQKNRWRYCISQITAGDIVEERREAIANLCDNEREHHIQRSVGSFVFKGSVGGIGSVRRSFGGISFVQGQGSQTSERRNTFI